MMRLLVIGWKETPKAYFIGEIWCIILVLCVGVARKVVSKAGLKEERTVLTLRMPVDLFDPLEMNGLTVGR
jgi:hypothetical protein